MRGSDRARYVGVRETSSPGSRGCRTQDFRDCLECQLVCAGGAGLAWGLQVVDGKVTWLLQTAVDDPNLTERLPGRLDDLGRQKRENQQHLSVNTQPSRPLPIRQGSSPSSLTIQSQRYHSISSQAIQQKGHTGSPSPACHRRARRWRTGPPGCYTPASRPLP